MATFPHLPLLLACRAPHYFWCNLLRREDIILAVDSTFSQTSTCASPDVDALIWADASNVALWVVRMSQSGLMLLYYCA
ncbi:hypothetical protein ElyMa_001654100 [Elysia marginata]|uniref:Uncharacterized protein n=1 Tax=Elysia marginata TaxID=1093978 RepID=A0AAV4JNS8_9GAST|nr:hypothetical protein ElyMa_001654100 [Elysia marginata]